MLIDNKFTERGEINTFAEKVKVFFRELYVKQ
jgi:hypothetical protein